MNYTNKQLKHKICLKLSTCNSNICHTFCNKHINKSNLFETMIKQIKETHDSQQLKHLLSSLESLILN